MSLTIPITIRCNGSYKNDYTCNAVVVTDAVLKVSDNKQNLRLKHDIRNADPALKDWRIECDYSNAKCPRCKLHG